MVYVIKVGEDFFVRGSKNNSGSYWTTLAEKAWEFKTKALAKATLKNVQWHTAGARIVERNGGRYAQMGNQVAKQ